MQVRWDDQSQYHQGFESFFVGGRLSALLPPPAEKTLQREPYDSKGYTLMDMRTDLIAVPHANLRDPNPERSRKVLKNLEVCKKK